MNHCFKARVASTACGAISDGMNLNENGLSPRTKNLIQIICPTAPGSSVIAVISNSESGRLVLAVSTSTLSFARPLTILQRKIFVLGTRCMALIDCDVSTADKVIESSTVIVPEAANMSIAP